MANGSLAEVENQLQIAYDIRYVKEDEFKELSVLINATGKLLYSFIQTAKKRKNS